MNKFSLILSLLFTTFTFVSCSGDSGGGGGDDPAPQDEESTGGTAGGTTGGTAGGTTGGTTGGTVGGTTGGTVGGTAGGATGGTSGGGNACLNSTQESNIRTLFTKLSNLSPLGGTLRIVPNPDGTEVFNGNGLANFGPGNANAWRMISEFTDDRNTYKLISTWSFERGCLFSLADQARILSSSLSSLKLRMTTSDGTVVEEKLNVSGPSNFEYDRKFIKNGETEKIQSYDLFEL
jgi:hypothetical protein